MKNLFRITVLLVASQACMAAEAREVPKDVSIEVAKLIRDLSRPDSLQKTQQTITAYKYHGGPEPTELESIEQAKKVIPKLRKLIAINTSVFSYPGLIAHGRVSYEPISEGDPFAQDAGLGKRQPTEWGYLLDLGIPKGGEGIHSLEFRVAFDSKGIIR